MRPIRVVTFNVYVGNKPEEVHKQLVKLERATGADLFALQEAKRYNGTIGNFHRFTTFESELDGGNQLWLIRNQLKVLRERVIPTGGGTYTGPHGDTRGEKEYPSLRVKKDGHVYRFLNIHHSTRTPGAADNRTAERNAIIDWFGSRVPSAAVGDWNSGEHTMEQYAREIGGTYSLFGVDGALMEGMKIVRVRRLLRKYGSDHHHPIVYDFLPKGVKK